MTSEYQQMKPADRMLLVLGMDDLTHAEKCVMAALAYHDGKGGCYPSLPALSGHLSTKQWNVSAHLDKLEEKGRIKRQKTQTVNQYILFYDRPCFQAIPESTNDIGFQENPSSGFQEIPGSAFKKSLKGTGRTGIREEREKVTRKKNVSTGKTQLVGYREEVLADGTRIPVEVYE